MNDIDLIKALKQNKKPFGLMSEEMQVKAKEIGQPEFSMYMKNKDWFPCGGCDNFHGTIVNDQTYRLRPDYEEKPEIVECEVYVSEKGYLHYRKTGHKPLLSKAIDHPDFIGFKHDDGTEDIYNAVIMYKWQGSLLSEIGSAHILSGKSQVSIATHVLFQVTK